MLVHLNGDFITGSKLAVAFCGGGVDVALQRIARVVFDRAVGWNLPNTGASEILSVLPEILPCGVRVGGGSKASKNSNCLHV